MQFYERTNRLWQGKTEPGPPTTDAFWKARGHTKTTGAQPPVVGFGCWILRCFLTAERQSKTQQINKQHMKTLENTPQKTTVFRSKATQKGHTPTSWSGKKSHKRLHLGGHPPSQTLLTPKREPPTSVVSKESFGDKGYAGYRVANEVKRHEAQGVGGTGLPIEWAGERRTVVAETFFFVFF